MSTKYLGNTIDVHSGGADLRFPHHECEIAQVEPVTNQKPFVRYWMHAAMVYHEGEKMSKSLGNLIMVRDILKDCPPDALRLYLGLHHYRESWSFSKRDLELAARNANFLKEAILLPSSSGQTIDTGSAWAAFHGAMSNDLNTPEAYRVMLGLASLLPKHLAPGGIFRKPRQP
jgi:L-cysteine:1D-myo-inositol 2-amino-2-deoxy-alpha-D-glucopyranoside ligase